jgi:hypothetical protein
MEIVELQKNWKKHYQPTNEMDCLYQIVIGIKMDLVIQKSQRVGN